MLTDKPWRAEAVAQMVMAAFVCQILSALWFASNAAPAGESTGALRTLGATLTFQGAVVVLLWFFTRKHAVSLNEAFGLHLHPGRAVLLGVTVALAFVPVALGLKTGIWKLAELLDLQLPEQGAVALLKISNSWPDCAALGFMVIIAAPLAEEGLFRGVLYPFMRRHGFPNAALWVTSLAFALIHFNVLIFIPLVVLAIVLVKLYEHTGNLLACVACHATFNAFNFVMFFAMNDSATKPGP